MIDRRVLVAAVLGASALGCARTPAATRPLREPSPADDASDPRVVRCGVDEVPLRASRAGSLPVRVASSPFPFPMPPGVAMFPPPEITPPVARLGPIELTDAEGRKLPAEREEPLFYRLGDLHPCASLASAERDGESSRVVVDLASSGVPLRAATDAMPTAMVRCVLERACRLQGAHVAHRVAFSVRAVPDVAR